ncbi:MAG: hypothetical protein MK085_08550 [Phycisphaerales bacterium]|nr:hypothetical protein [Phycisphaerales bacterium]
MPRTSPAIPIACFVAIASFLVAMLVGGISGNEFSSVVGRALLALLIAWPLGYLAGMVLEHQFATHAPDAPEEAIQAPGEGIEGEFDEEIVVDEQAVESDGSSTEDPLVHVEEGVATGPS